MEKKTDSLLFRFSVIFALFALMTLLMCGISIYYTHMNAYEHQCEENVKHVENYLEDLMKAEGQDFINFQDFFIANHVANTNKCFKTSTPIKYWGMTCNSTN